MHTLIIIYTSLYFLCLKLARLVNLFFLLSIPCFPFLILLLLYKAIIYIVLFFRTLSIFLPIHIINRLDEVLHKELSNNINCNYFETIKLISKALKEELKKRGL